MAKNFNPLDPNCGKTSEMVKSGVFVVSSKRKKMTHSRITKERHVVPCYLLDSCSAVVLKFTTY